MSQIGDYGCDRRGCQRDAAELAETDENQRVLLCRRCYEDAEIGNFLTLRNGRMLMCDTAGLMCDTAGTWFFLPEREAAR